MIWDIPALLNTIGPDCNQLYKSKTAEGVHYTWEDVSAALGMGNLPLESYYLGRYLIFDDTTYKQKLIKLVITEAENLALIGTCQQDHMNLAQLARLVCEELKVMSVCSLCKGLGFIKAGNKCRFCAGYGWKSFSEKEKYQFLKVTKASWYQNWQQYYIRLLNYLGDAAYHLREHLAIHLY